MSTPSGKVRSLHPAPPMLAVLLLLLSSPARAELNTGVTLASKYMTGGFNVGGNHPVWQLGADLSIPIPGVSLGFWSSLPVERSRSRYDEFDLMVSYFGSFLKDSRYGFNLHGFYDYWIYPGNELPQFDEAGNSLASWAPRGNKIQAGFSMPRLVTVDGWGIVPSYNLSYYLYWDGGKRSRFQGGTLHEFMLGYGHSIPTLIPGAKSQTVSVGTSMNYNNGAFGVRPAWSHATAHVLTQFEAAGGWFSLRLERQWSYEPTVNPEHEIWSSLSYGTSF